MTQSPAASIGQIHDLLASKRYSVSETSDSVLKIRDVESGIVLSAVIEGEILFFSLTCMVVPEAKITPQLMKKMLSASNGISTSHFQLYESSGTEVAITLNNFCKLQDLGAEDEDDILSCVNFLLADVVHARDLIGSDL